MVVLAPDPETRTMFVVTARPMTASERARFDRRGR
jgi:hypothetical protein